MADYETEKFMKRIAGRTDVEDALQRLDILTKEENIMTAARNLQVTHQVDINVKETKELTRDVRDDVKVTKHCAPNSFGILIHFTHLCLLVMEAAIDEQRRSFSPWRFHRQWSSLRHAHRESATREA